MKKILFLHIICSLFCAFTCFSQEQQRTKIYNDAIKTLEIKIGDYDFSNPVLMLAGDDVMRISFDELSHETKNYSYKIEHCNADWTVSNISEFEYLDGINLVDIVDYEQSVNTTFNYTHYFFSFPNKQVKPKISGNYIITVFESDKPNKPCLKARFYIVEQIADIDAKVKSNTDLGINTKYQQVDFDVFTQKLNTTNPASEIKVCVRQNSRTDNEVGGINPTFIANNKLTYANNKALIFEAGNEYRSLDISNIRILDANVQEIKYIAPYFHVDMFGEKARNTHPYSFVNDVNGKFIVNLQRSNYGSNVEADYLFVHFFYPTETPFFTGNVHLVGGFNGQLLGDQSRMEYNSEVGGYVKSVLLKQGGSNYMYLYQPKGSTKGSTEQIEGNFWQTENEYEIFVYHRPAGSRFDRLVGYQVLNSEF
jgi:hypothetical protein